MGSEFILKIEKYGFPSIRDVEKRKAVPTIGVSFTFQDDSRLDTGVWIETDT